MAIVAMAMASGVGCSAETTSSHQTVSDTDQHLNTPLGTTPGFVLGAHSAPGVVTVTLAANESVELYMNPADSSLMVNNKQVLDTATGKLPAYLTGTKANVKSISITGAGVNTIILNYVNGLFGVGTGTTAALAGTSINVAANSTLLVKGTTGNDSFAVGQNGVSLSAGAKAPKSPTLDIVSTNAINYNFYLGDGDDTFTSTLAVTGAALANGCAIYGGNGNDTLIEATDAMGAALSPSETFSGGPGTDTVDYSARTLPVSVIVNAAGTMTSGGGAFAMAATDPTTAAPAEGDLILDADVVKGGSGNDWLMGDITGAFTLNGGLGNDIFFEGTDSGSTVGVTCSPGGTVCPDYSAGTDTIVGGGGVDTVDYSQRTRTLAVTMNGSTKSGDSTGNAGAGENDLVGADVQNIRMGSGSGSTYTGNTLNNVFFVGTGAGSATVNGLAGDDTLDEGTDASSTLTAVPGTPGTPYVVCDTGGVNPVCPDNSGATEVFNGGTGIDVVDYSKRSAALTIVMDGMTTGGAGSEADVVGTDVENLWGSVGNNHITGNALDNDLEGNVGDDVICGLAGNDTLVADPHANGGTANDQLHGNDCADATHETGAFNACLNIGAGTPLAAPAMGTAAQAAYTANCEVYIQ